MVAVLPTLFAFKALQGELLANGDPYLIPQKGYCHAWDCHGGGGYLQRHTYMELQEAELVPHIFS